MMPFIHIEGVDELVFIPAEQKCSEKKHPCADCHSCQWCSDERCGLCRKRNVRSQECRVSEEVREK